MGHFYKGKSLWPREVNMIKRLFGQKGGGWIKKPSMQAVVEDLKSLRLVRCIERNGNSTRWVLTDEGEAFWNGELVKEEARKRRRTVEFLENRSMR